MRTFSRLVLALLIGCASVPSEGSLRDRVRDGELATRRGARPEHGTLFLRSAGDTLVALEARRGPDNTVMRRVQAPGFVVEEAAGEIFHDVAIHPSGAITIALEGASGYELARYDSAGNAIERAPLPMGATLPTSDLGEMPNPPWSMRAREMSALSQGWLRIAPIEEDAVVAFVSLASDAEPNLVTGVMWLEWRADHYSETRTRIA